MSETQRAVIDRYLRTGDEDDSALAQWPGQNVVEKMRAAHAAFRGALVEEVKRRAGKMTLPKVPPATKLRTMTRRRVEPMVRGLFPKVEQDVVLGLLEKSVVFLTPSNIEQVLTSQRFGHSAWTLANLYLVSIDAEPLGGRGARVQSRELRTEAGDGRQGA